MVVFFNFLRKELTFALHWVAPESNQDPIIIATWSK